MESEASPEVESLLAKAIDQHRAGELSKAEWAYEELLEQSPEHAEALQLLGVIAAQMGNTTLAIERVRKSVSINPDQPVALNNLGSMLAKELQFDEAIEVYRRAIELKPNYAQAHHHLGNVLVDCDRLFDAIDSYSRAVELVPDDAQSWYALGAALEKVARFDEAVQAFRKSNAIDPGFIGALNRLGAVLRKSGELEEARDAYQKWLELAPNDPIANHFLLVCGEAQDAPQRASTEYVKSTFDNFADDFDSKLSDLDYQVPDLIGARVEKIVQDSQCGKLRVADLGCGTGLCGKHLRDHADQLIGVDLSPNMLAKANERDLYDELVEGELTEYLAGCSDDFDLLVSADTLIYVGDLQSTFAAAAAALRPGGWFVFSVEKLDSSDVDDDDDDCGYRLCPTGRYTHAEAHVRKWLSDNGFSVGECTQEKCREEGNHVTTGYLITAVRE